MLRVLTCTQYHPGCSANASITVPANPDIAGIGVVVSFLSTTCLAFLIAFAVLFLDRYEWVVNFFRKHFTNKKTTYSQDPAGPYWRSAEFWSRVLSKNLLAFSDTQLVTGLAIQFTALLQHCQLTIYHFRVVTDLAFLTTVTHLLAVVTLRNYFVKNKWINLPRIFFMLANLALLGYTSFVAYSYDLAGLNMASSLACFYQGKRPPFKAAFGGRWAVLLICAIGGHATILLAMYMDDTPKTGSKTLQYTLKWLGALFRTWLLAPVYAIYGIVMAGIDLRQTQALGTPKVKIDGSEKQWGFGQFLPVLLLALPLFAGWESFWEEKDEDRENRFGRQSRSRSQLVLPKASASPHQGTSSAPDSDNEARIESNGPSPIGTPRNRSASRPSLHPDDANAISLVPLPSPNLSIPSPTMSPRSGSMSPVRTPRRARGQSTPNLAITPPPASPNSQAAGLGLGLSPGLGSQRPRSPSTPASGLRTG